MRPTTRRWPAACSREPGVRCATPSCSTQPQGWSPSTTRRRDHSWSASGPPWSAFVLIQTDASRIPESAQAISEIEGISEVYSVTGEWDLIAIARVSRHEDLADVIADRLSKIEGIRSTTTQIAFRSYSQHDLDAAFSLGFES